LRKKTEVFRGRYGTRTQEIKAVFVRGGPRRFLYRG